MAEVAQMETGGFLEPMSDSSKFRRMVDLSRTQGVEEREKGCKAQRYFDSDQLSQPIKDLLRLRGQPETVRNHIQPAVNGVHGVLIANKVDPRAYPRNPEDEQGADVVSKVLRYVADKSHFARRVKSPVIKDHLIRGMGACIVEYADDEVTPRYIPAREFFRDPYAQAADYSDARWLGQGKWMYAEDLAGLYPELGDAIDVAAVGDWSSTFGGGYGETWEDKPQAVIPWFDKATRRLLVVDLYSRDRKGWRRTVFFAGGVLEDGPSPYVDDKNEPMCPIEASSCYIDENLNRYGIVDVMMSLQDEVNARASRGLHLINTRQVQATDLGQAAAADIDVVRQQAARADGAIPIGWSVVPTTDMQQGNLAVLQEVKAEMDRLAPTPAVLGRQGQSDQSGRARLVLQQAGMTELEPATEGVEDFENRCYRQMWLRVRQFKREPWFVRVTNDEKAFEFLQVNEPEFQMEPVVDPQTGQPAINDETGEPLMQKALVPQPVKGQDGQPVVDPQTGQPQMQPQPLVIGTKHRLLDMDMDIEVETVPDTANLAAETFEAMLQQTPAGVAAYGARPWMDAMWLVNPLPNKAEIKETLEKGAQQLQQQQAQAQQQAAQEAEAERSRKAAETGAKVNLQGAQAQHQTAAAALLEHETHGQHIQNAADIAFHSTPQPGGVIPEQVYNPGLSLAPPPQGPAQ